MGIALALAWLSGVLTTLGCVLCRLMPRQSILPPPPWPPTEQQVQEWLDRR
jgi:hypothetical protein